MSKKSIRLLFASLVAAVFVYLAFRKTDWREVGQVLSVASLTWLLAGLVCLAADYILRIQRWRFMLNGSGSHVRFSLAASPFLISYAVNNVLPFRSGDLYRIFGFRDKLERDASTLTASLVLERVLDLITLCLFVCAGLLLLGASIVAKEFLWLLGGVLIAGFLGLLMGAVLPGPIARWVRHSRLEALTARHRALCKVHEILIQFTDAILLFLKAGRGIGLILYSLSAWALEGGLFACVLIALGVGEFAWLAPWFVLGFATLSTLIPGLPGHVGTFHYFVIQGLLFWSVPEPEAVASAILVHLMLWIPVTISGLVSFTAHHALKPSVLREGVLAEAKE